MMCVIRVTTLGHVGMFSEKIESSSPGILIRGVLGGSGNIMTMYIHTEQTLSAAVCCPH